MLGENVHLQSEFPATFQNFLNCDIYCHGKHICGTFTEKYDVTLLQKSFDEDKEIKYKFDF